MNLVSFQSIIIETIMTLSEEDPNNRQAAEYYKQKIIQRVLLPLNVVSVCGLLE